jgi:hypothetical protein
VHGRWALAAVNTTLGDNFVDEAIGQTVFLNLGDWTHALSGPHRGRPVGSG